MKFCVKTAPNRPVCLRGTEMPHKASKVPFGPGSAKRPQAAVGHDLGHGNDIAPQEVDVPPDNERGELGKIRLLDHPSLVLELSGHFQHVDRIPGDQNRTARALRLRRHVDLLSPNCGYTR